MCIKIYKSTRYFFLHNLWREQLWSSLPFRVLLPAPRPSVSLTELQNLNLLCSLLYFFSLFKVSVLCFSLFHFYSASTASTVWISAVMCFIASAGDHHHLKVRKHVKKLSKDGGHLNTVPRWYTNLIRSIKPRSSKMPSSCSSSCHSWTYPDAKLSLLVFLQLRFLPLHAAWR